MIGIRSAWLAVVAVAASACGGSSTPAAPTPRPAPTTPAVPAAVTLTGHVTATNGGQPLPAVTASFNSASGAITATTDASGTFTMRFSRVTEFHPAQFQPLLKDWFADAGV